MPFGSTRLTPQATSSLLFMGLEMFLEHVSSSPSHTSFSTTTKVASYTVSWRCLYLFYLNEITTIFIMAEEFSSGIIYISLYIYIYIKTKTNGVFFV
jgi:hypothetical protein